MDPEGQLRNLRDFLLVYNRMTEICFQRCTKNFNYRNLTMDEERCADHCAGKLIRSNHRLMGTYVQLMPTMVQRRMEELESRAAEMAKATEAGGSAEPLAGGSNPTGSHFATPTPGVPTPGSAAEQAGTAASGSPVQTTPTTPNKTSGSVAHTVPVVTESAHADVTSPLLERLKDSAPSGNPSVPCGNVDVNSSMSSPASEHRSTGGEGPPS